MCQKLAPLELRRTLINSVNNLTFVTRFYSFAAVRYGRVPKRSRERMEEQQQRVVSSNQQQQIESEQLESSRELALYDLTLTVAQAHHAHCDYTEMRTRGLVRKPAIFVSH